MNKIINLNAHEMAHGIKSGKFTSVQLVQAHLEQIEKLNDKVNAIVTLFPDALKKAKEADVAIKRGENWGVLHGVPITIKDSWETKGIKTTASYKPLKNYIPKKNAIVVENILSQGAIILGKTNLPMLASDIQTNSPIFGKSNNPWDFSKTTGGSTGGGAAAVSVRFSPIEIGSDLAGSIRIPAHFCGVLGFKPTEGVLSLTGHIPPKPNKPVTVLHQAHVGIIARSVEDLKIAFECMKGETFEGDGKDNKEFNVAYLSKFGNLQVNKDTLKEFNRFQLLISKHFNSIEDKPLNINFDKIWETYGQICGYEIGGDMNWFSRFIFKQLFRKSDPIYKGFYSGLGMNKSIYLNALSNRTKIISLFDIFFKQYDIWICPVSMRQAFSHTRTGKNIKIDNKKVAYFTASAAYTTIFNVTGLPVIVIPIGVASDGLPIGVQLVANLGNDELLLNFAKKVEKLLPNIANPNISK